MSARICMMSLRLPLARLLKVGGNSEAMLNQTVPLLPHESTSRFLAEVGACAEVVSATSYFFHAPVRAATRAPACTAPPSLLTMAMVIGPLKSALALA